VGVFVRSDRELRRPLVGLVVGIQWQRARRRNPRTASQDKRRPTSNGRNVHENKPRSRQLRIYGQSSTKAAMANMDRGDLRCVLHLQHGLRSADPVSTHPCLPHGGSWRPWGFYPPGASCSILTLAGISLGSSLLATGEPRNLPCRLGLWLNLSVPVIYWWCVESLGSCASSYQVGSTQRCPLKTSHPARETSQPTAGIQMATIFALSGFPSASPCPTRHHRRGPAVKTEGTRGNGSIRTW